MPTPLAYDGILYMAMGLRNVGAGLAVLHGWHVKASDDVLTLDGAGASRLRPPDAEEFRRQHRDLERSPAVRQDEIHGPALKLAAERPPQGNECDEPDVRAPHEWRQLGLDRSVEAGNERDDTIVVAESVELACELECDDLGAASLGATDEMQDAQPRHAAMAMAFGPISACAFSSAAMVSSALGFGSFSKIGR